MPVSTKRQEYRGFVESGLAEADDEFMSMLKESPLSIGSDEFRARIHDLHVGLTLKQKRPEDASFRRTTEPLPVSIVVSKTSEFLGVSVEEIGRRRRDSLVRPLVARMLCKHAGLSQREVADRMGVKSGAAVSQQLRRLEESVKRDKAVRKQIDELDKILKTAGQALNC